MGKKGLCVTCVNDKDCTFSRKFPILQCEEFSDYQPTEKKDNDSTIKYSKQRQVHCIDTETTEPFD